MNEIILILLILLSCLVGFNIYLNLKKADDKHNEDEEILSEITESLHQQENVLQNQKEDIVKLTLGLSEFNYPLKQLTRYLSGGTLAGRFGEGV